MTTLRGYQFSNIVSAAGVAPARAYQMAGIISVTELIPNRNYQLAAVISTTVDTVVRAFQFAIIVSVSPSKPRPHYPVNVQCRGPVNLLKDMPVSGKGKN